MAITLTGNVTQCFLIFTQRPLPKREEAYLGDAKGPVKTDGNGLVDTKEASVAHRRPEYM